MAVRLFSCLYRSFLHLEGFTMIVASGKGKMNAFLVDANLKF